MLTKEDIEHLSTLARIAISEDEKEELAGRVDAVLAYVSTVSKVVTEAESSLTVGELRNVMREDGEAFPGGEYTQAILANAPHQEDGYIKVGQIF